MDKKLRLSSTDKKLAGVCGGIAEYFKFDPTIVRIIFVLLVLLTKGFAIILYIALWAILPLDDDSKL